jgi:hypothetical protein
MNRMRVLALVMVLGIGGCALSHERTSTSCAAGSTRSCTSPLCSPCHVGTQVCQADGTWGECAISCGPPCDAGPPTPGDAWIDGTDGGALPVDAYVAPPDADRRDTGTAPPSTRSGWVYVEDLGDGAPQIGLSAYFSGSSTDDVRRGLWSPDCAIVGAVGACHAVRCPHVDHAGDLAGTLTVSVAGSLLMSASSPTPASAFYGGATFDSYVAGADGSALSGRSVTIRASGDVVPAFETTLVAAPFLVTTLPTTVSRSHDVTVRWAPITASEVWIVIGQLDLASTEPWILCRTAGSDASLTVDHTLLAAHPTGESLYIDALAFQTTTVSAPPYAIDVFVGTVVVGTVTVAP